MTLVDQGHCLVAGKTLQNLPLHSNLGPRSHRQDARLPHRGPGPRARACHGNSSPGAHRARHLTRRHLHREVQARRRPAALDAHNPPVH